MGIESSLSRQVNLSREAGELEVSRVTVIGSVQGRLPPGPITLSRLASLADLSHCMGED